MAHPSPDPARQREPGPSGWRGAVDWLFRSRETGRITIAQLPNPALIAWLVLLAVRRLTTPAGAAGSVVDGLVVAALAWWAGDEVLRGVNPWRRLLGATVLGFTVVGIATRGSLA